MPRSLLSRLPQAWRAGENSLLPDVALAVALTLAAGWSTMNPWGLSFGDHGSFTFGADQSFGANQLGGPDILAPSPPVMLAVPSPWTAADLCLNLALTVPLIGRRRWPLACLIAQFAGLLLFDIELNAATLAALLIGVYSLAVHGRSALLSMGTLLAVAGLTALTKDDTWPEMPDWAGIFAILIPIGLFGVAVRTARGRARAAHHRAEAVTREQHATTRLAVAQEQARIARELHDVVSHHVSVMIIQAGAAGKVLDAQPELARDALAAIETSGRETMTELRHLLGVLAPGPSDDLLHPQPGLEQLEALIDRVRRTGQLVTVERTPVMLPRGLDLTAYRVVQEALTNALRHAPRARTRITIGPEPSNGRTDLVIDVTNEAAPLGAGTGPGRGAGAGLLGLAERLRLYGGTLETSPQVDGGFQIRARIPLEKELSRPQPLEAG